MWQSLARRVGSSEVDHLNGEIVRIARAHGGHAPVNERLQELCRRAVVEHRRPASMDAADLLAELVAATAAAT